MLGPGPNSHPSFVYFSFYNLQLLLEYVILLLQLANPIIRMYLILIHSFLDNIPLLNQEFPVSNILTIIILQLLLNFLLHFPIQSLRSLQLLNIFNTFRHFYLFILTFARTIALPGQSILNGNI